MNKRNLWFYSALGATIIVLTLLVTGSSLLLCSLDKKNNIPLGTLLTWIGMVSLPLTIFWGIKELRKPTNTFNKLLSGIIKIVILLGIFWVPISYLLSGNLSFSFSERETFQGSQAAMQWFWRLSYGIGIGALSTLIIYWISLFFKKR